MQTMFDAIYHLALDLFIEYRQISSYGHALDPKFIWLGKNILMKTSAITPEYDYMFRHMEELNVDELISSELPTEEFRKLNNSKTIRNVMIDVFRTMSKPIIFTSIVDKQVVGIMSSLVISIPDIVLYIAETMIRDQVNIQFFHYFNIDRHMFDRYVNIKCQHEVLRG